MSSQPFTTHLAPSASELERLFGSVVAEHPCLMAVFEPVSLRLLYVNVTGRRLLDSRGEAGELLEELTLWDMVGINCVDRFRASVYPNFQLRGRWSGRLEMRDVWGGEFTVCGSFIAQRAPGEGGQRYTLLQAMDLGDSLSVGEEGMVGDRELLATLLRYSEDAIYFKDRHGRFLRVSESLARKLGAASAGELMGKTDFDFFSPTHACPAFEDERRIMESGTPIVDKEEEETRSETPNTWVSTTKMPLRDASGEIIGTFGISRDITERKRYERERRSMETKLQLAHRMESIGSLAAGVAHEINTPTQFVADNLRFLAESFHALTEVLAASKGLLSEDAKRELERVEREHDLGFILEEVGATLSESQGGLEQIGRIVNSLKEYSHPGQDEKAPGDLNRSVRGAVNVSRHEWKYVAEVAFELDASLPCVPCRIHEMNQVFLNLIVNAAHAIEARGDGLGVITARSYARNDWAWVEICDTGTGIAEADRTRIFDPFYTTKEVGKGTGQGLAIVQSVVVAGHGGVLEVESELGKGSCFRVGLPLFSEEDAAAELHDGDNL